jgi:hypothetical protein
LAGWLDGWMEGQPLFPFFLFLRARPFPDVFLYDDFRQS